MTNPRPKISASAARKDTFSFDDVLATEEIVASDDQASNLRLINDELSSVRELIRESMSGLDIPDHLVERTATICVSIRSQFRKSIEASIDIGRSLIEAEKLLPPRAFSRFADFEHLGFSNAMASKYMTVARAIDEQRFHRVLGDKMDLTRLPPFSAMYELSTLDDEHLVLAREKNLFRPETTFRQVLDFKSEIVRKTAPVSMSYESAIKKKASLTRKLKKLQASAGAIEVKIQEIDAFLKDARESAQA